MMAPALSKREQRILQEIERDLQVDRALDRQLREMRPKRVPGLPELRRGLRAFGRTVRGYSLFVLVLVSVWLIPGLLSPAPATTVALCAVVWTMTSVLLGLRLRSRLKSHPRQPVDGNRPNTRRSDP